RASAKFVTCARKFEAKIDVTRDGTNVPGTSIMGLMMLAASLGCSIKISAEGADAEIALAELVTLVKNGFGENDAD
ncbi:MAG: HPr family phosphocarrier protein, partial [Pseudomonadota bacterium]|nr:HPr family phosphocarrier protein [Pseudomonadota bacterium]